MGRKEGGCYAPFAELGARLLQCGLGRGLLPHQVASSSIQPFGHNRHGPKIGWGGYALSSGGSWVPMEHKVTWAEAYLHTKWHHSPSYRLATTDTGRKLGVCAPLGEGEPGPNLAQCPVGRGLPPSQVAS